MVLSKSMVELKVEGIVFVMQRSFASSPTFSIESVMLSCVIDASDGQDDSTLDTPNVFLHVGMEDTVHLKLEGAIAKLLLPIELKMFKRYIQSHNGKLVVIVEVKSSLYYTQDTLMIWKHLTNKSKKLYLQPTYMIYA
jgi:hypothetical protein